MGLLSNYCGPGGNGQVEHSTDSCCQVHDTCYTGDTVNKYLFYNECDERFLNCLNKAKLSSLREKVVNTASSAFFKFKRRFQTPKKVHWDTLESRRIERLSASKDAKQKFIERIRGDKCWKKQLFRDPVTRSSRVFRKSNSNNKVWLTKRGRGRGQRFGGSIVRRRVRRNIHRRRGRIRGGSRVGIVAEAK